MGALFKQTNKQIKMKKTVAAIAIALTTVLSANAQNLSMNEVDEFTGQTKKVTEYYKVGKGNGYNLRLSVVQISDGKTSNFGMYFRTNVDLGCSGSVDEYVIFKFTDGTTAKYEGIGDVDCTDYAISTFIINIEDFKDKTVEKIRLRRSDYYNDYEVEGNYTVSELLTAVN